MTHKEAYELLVKYAGEKGIIMIKEMIHVAGIEVALKNMERAYSNQNKGKDLPEDFKIWMRQSFEYLTTSQEQAN